MPTLDVTFTYQTEDAADILATFTPDAKAQFGTETPTNAQVASAMRASLRKYLASRVHGYRVDNAAPSEPVITEA